MPRRNADAVTHENRSSNQRYVEAERRLKAEHAEDFTKHLKAVYSEDGLTYQPRLTAEQRAERDRQAALAKARQKIEALHLEFGDALFVGTDPDLP